MAPLSLALSIAYLPSTLAIAHRAYAELAVVRVVTLLAFGATAVLLGSKMTPVIMAWLLQLTLVVQGIALFIAILPVCARHDRELV
jgi:hypothetical protein